MKNYCTCERNNFLIDGINVNQIMFVYDKYSDLRRKTVRNHVEFNDYFGTLATILNCIRESYEEIEKDPTKNIVLTNRENLKRLDNLKNDLLYLQNNFIIAKKEKDQDYIYQRHRSKNQL